MNTRILFLAIVLVCLIVAPGVTQENSDQPSEWALQFQIGDDFRLFPFQGTTISVSKQLASDRKLRMGMSAEGSYSENATQSHVYETRNNLSLSVYSHYIWELKKNTKIVPFAGIGPKLNFSYDNFEKSDGNTPKNTHTSWGIGVSGMFGVEWFVKPNISLLAEYGSSVVYSKSKNKETHIYSGDGTTEREYERTYTGYQFRSDGVKFGVSIYF